LGLNVLFDKPYTLGDKSVKLKMIQIPSPELSGYGILLRRDFLALLLEEARARGIATVEAGTPEIEDMLKPLRGVEKNALIAPMAAPVAQAVVPIWDDAAGTITIAGLDAHLDISSPRDGKVRFKSIHVSPELRKRGIGRALARVALAQAEARRLTPTFDPQVSGLFESIRRERLAAKGEEVAAIHDQKQSTGERVAA
jgi:ribosomal protein S18 acetylase RimI-like enzyme